MRLAETDRQNVPQTWCGNTKRTIAEAGSWRRPAAATNWQSSVKHCGACPCSALNTSTASLNWTHWRTGSQCSCRRTGDRSLKVIASDTVRLSNYNFLLVIDGQFFVHLVYTHHVKDFSPVHLRLNDSLLFYCHVPVRIVNSTCAAAAFRRVRKYCLRPSVSVRSSHCSLQQHRQVCKLQ